MACERSPQSLDTVVWERDGGLYTGIIGELRGQYASIITGHGGALVHTENLEVIVRRDDWHPESLQNHLWAVYGVRLMDDCDPTSNAAANGD